MSKFDDKENLLKLTSDVFNSLLEGLSQVDYETMKKVMEFCGEACARSELFGPAIDIARIIADEETDEARILDRMNREIEWCGTWVKAGDTIQCICTRCGCPLVQKGVVTRPELFCYCSRGWVKIIFETLLGKPVSVELEKAIGFGDDVCQYLVYPR
jgi:hypothetical protein